MCAFFEYVMCFIKKHYKVFVYLLQFILINLFSCGASQSINVLMVLFLVALCRNSSLGLATKRRACKGVGQEGSPGVTSRATESVGKCGGKTPHTHKRALTLGVEVLVDSRIFREQLQGSKPNG
jgi:hypothetical protein